MKVVVFTTSYPRHADDFAGRFVSDPVERLRARGLEVEVVHPGVYKDYGVAYQGGGIMHAVRRRPWIAPLLAMSMIRALRRAARDADLVHAMWLAGGVVALFSGKPFVVSLLGSISAVPLDDFALMRKRPRLVRFICHRARATICISEALVESAREAGIRNIRFIPIGIEIPETVGEEADPPEVFYTGRLSREKGVEDLAAAREGLNLIVSGDGPLRSSVPRRARLHLARRAGGALPAGRGRRRPLAERGLRRRVRGGDGARQGRGRRRDRGPARPRPGRRDRPARRARNPKELRAAIDRLLADPALRKRLGENARAWITELCSWDKVIAETIETYEQALGSHSHRG